MLIRNYGEINDIVNLNPIRLSRLLVHVGVTWLIMITNEAILDHNNNTFAIDLVFLAS
jgi:hypothetical protein